MCWQESALINYALEQEAAERTIPQQTRSPLIRLFSSAKISKTKNIQKWLGLALCVCMRALFSCVRMCVCMHCVCVCIWIQFLFARITVLHCHVSSFLQVCRFDNSAYWHVLRFGGSFHIAACAANSSAILSDIGNGYMEAVAATLPISLTWGNPVNSQLLCFRWHCLPNLQTHWLVWPLPMETSVVGFHHLAPKQHGLKSASFARQVFTMWKNWSVLSKYDDAGCSNAAGTLHS